MSGHTRSMLGYPNIERTNFKAGRHRFEGWLTWWRCKTCGEMFSKHVVDGAMAPTDAEFEALLASVPCPSPARVVAPAGVA